MSRPVAIGSKTMSPLSQSRIMPGWLRARVSMSIPPRRKICADRIKTHLQGKSHAGTLPGLNPWVNHTDTACRGIQNLFLGKWMWMRAHPLENRSGKRLRSFGSLHTVEQCMYVLSKLRGLSQMDGYSLCKRGFWRRIWSCREDGTGLKESRTSL